MGFQFDPFCVYFCFCCCCFWLLNSNNIQHFDVTINSSHHISDREREKNLYLRFGMNLHKKKEQVCAFVCKQSKENQQKIRQNHISNEKKLLVANCATRSVVAVVAVVYCVSLLQVVKNRRPVLLRPPPSFSFFSLSLMPLLSS